MDLEQIKSRVKEIDDCKHDDEVAHGKEDALHIDFIKFVAENGNKKLSEMATEILKTEDISFARWCA